MQVTLASRAMNGVTLASQRFDLPEGGSGRYMIRSPGPEFNGATDQYFEVSITSSDLAEKVRDLTGRVEHLERNLENAVDNYLKGA